MRCNVKNRKLSPEELEQFYKENTRSADVYLNYVQRVILRELRLTYGFGEDRMRQLNDHGCDLGKWYIDRYSPEDVQRTDEEYAVDSYYALRRDLCQFGYDPEVELWEDGLFIDMVQPQPTCALRHKALQHGEYAERMGFYVREMLCMIAMELHETNGFGVSRIRRVMAPTRDRYLSLMRMYVDMDARSVKLELQRALTDFNDMKLFTKEYKL